MWRVKQLADPDGILGPGIVLNRDPGVHLRNLKSVPEIEESATKCIECGFCEPVCPSRNLTTTPRQRIALRREMARQPAGSPVVTALLDAVRVRRARDLRGRRLVRDRVPGRDRHRQAVKELRHTRARRPRRARRAASSRRRYAAAERAARASLRMGAVAARTVGDRKLAAASERIRARVGADRVPAWTATMPGAAPSQLPATSSAGAAAVYLPVVPEPDLR